MSQMVRGHRNHPSIAVFSACNEGGCAAGENATLFAAFRHIAKANDPTRAFSGNMRGSIGPGTLSDYIDVQGLSHPSLEMVEHAHKLNATKTVLASECCSCRTQRGENTLQPNKVWSAFNADCLQEQVGRVRVRLCVALFIVLCMYVPVYM